MIFILLLMLTFSGSESKAQVYSSKEGLKGTGSHDSSGVSSPLTRETCQTLIHSQKKFFPSATLPSDAGSYGASSKMDFSIEEKLNTLIPNRPSSLDPSKVPLGSIKLDLKTGETSLNGQIIPSSELTSELTSDLATNQKKCTLLFPDLVPSSSPSQKTVTPPLLPVFPSAVDVTP